MMNGCNPFVLRRCNKIPDKFPVTHQMVTSQLTRGIKLEEEVKVGIGLTIRFSMCFRSTHI